MWSASYWLNRVNFIFPLGGKHSDLSKVLLSARQNLIHPSQGCVENKRLHSFLIDNMIRKTNSLVIKQPMLYFLIIVVIDMSNQNSQQIRHVGDVF